jgi:beta-glucosidase-like glycosyl hydrolase
VRYETTALPQPITLASTFSTDLARQYGEILGRESRATRNDVLLAPMVNVMRLPHWGRNVTSFGEEPLVIARLAAAEIGGIQSTGVMANAKHFVANNQSLNQGGGIGGADGFDFVVDERTLHEIYLPGFESAMRAGVASIMAAYNKTNGYWNAENEANLTGILRKELHWQGFVVSDWHANRSTPSIAAGLDLEMPGQGPQYLTGREGPKWGAEVEGGDRCEGGRCAHARSCSRPRAHADGAIRISRRQARGGSDDDRCRGARAVCSQAGCPGRSAAQERRQHPAAGR